MPWSNATTRASWILASIKASFNPGKRQLRLPFPFARVCYERSLAKPQTRPSRRLPQPGHHHAVAPAGKLVAIALTAVAIAIAAGHFTASSAGRANSMGKDETPVPVAPSGHLPASTHTMGSSHVRFGIGSIRLPIAITLPGSQTDRPNGIDPIQLASMDWASQIARPAPAPARQPTPRLTSGMPVSNTHWPHSGSAPPAGPLAQPGSELQPPARPNDQPGATLGDHGEPRPPTDSSRADADAPGGPSKPGGNQGTSLVPADEVDVPTYEDATHGGYLPPAPPEHRSIDSPTPDLSAFTPPDPAGDLPPDSMFDLARPSAPTGLDQNSVPEPSTMGLLAIGLFALGWNSKGTAC